LSVAERAYWSFFISLAAQRRKFAIKDSNKERRLLIKEDDDEIQLRIIERPEERVNEGAPRYNAGGRLG
jgi:hypothetical protein